MTSQGRGPGLVEQLRVEARRLGFTLFGVAPPDSSEHATFYESWLDAGHHGDMAYLAREDARARRAEPASSYEGVRSVIVVGHEYGSGGQRPHSDGSDSTSALIARYARGSDYHSVIPARLRELLAWLDRRVAGGVRGRVLVDTAPVLERELAQRAGLGWFGKNTMLIHPRRGSYFLLGLLMVDLELENTGALRVDRCGTCSACIDACPTGALLGRDDSGAPVIDARRCISYLTIELKGEIPRTLRPQIGNRVFGCDICQEVCPWNERFAASRGDQAYDRQANEASLVDFAETLLPLSAKAYQRQYVDSPLARPGRRGMLRNVMVGIGNALGAGAYSVREEARVLQLLERALNDHQWIVRSHAAWALGRAVEWNRSRSRSRSAAVRPTDMDHPVDSGGTVLRDRAIRVLSERAAIESDVVVQKEIKSALEGA